MMTRAQTPLCWLLLASMLTLVACEAEPERAFIRPIKPFNRDMAMPGEGTQAPDFGSLGPLSPQCVSVLEGGQCDLPQATGVCIQGRCQLLSCLSGFASCDEDQVNGCEQPISTQEACGACQVSCRDLEQCQLGPSGYVCSVGVVCPVGRYDLDQRQDNGCEWEEQGERENTLQPVTFLSRVDQIEYFSQGGGFEVAVGALEDQGSVTRQVLTSKDTTGPYVLRTPGESAALGVSLPTSAYALVVWPELLSVHRLSGVRSDQEVTDMCQPKLAQDSWTWQSATAWKNASLPALQLDAMIVGEHTVMPLKRCNTGDVLACFWRQAQFSQADYVRAFFPYQAKPPALFSGAAGESARFTQGEVSACLPCVFDSMTGSLVEPLVCHEARQCRPLDFEVSSSCVSCTEEVLGCPSFLPKQVLQSRGQEGVVYVVTERGVVALRFDQEGGTWAAVGRQERVYEAGLFGGKKFEQGALGEGEGKERVFLLRSDRTVHVLDVQQVDNEVKFVPVAAPAGVDLKSTQGARLVGIDHQTVMLSSREQASVIRIGSRGPRRFVLDRGRDPDGKFFGVKGVPSGAAVLQQRFGNVWQRVVEQEK